MPTAVEDVLAGTTLFKNVSRDHVNDIAPLVQFQNFKAGQVIAKQGGLGRGLYIIRSGSADAVLNHGEDDEQVLATFGEGDFFGEISLLISRPRVASVVAKEATECLTFLRANFQDQALQAPQALWAMLEDLAERLANCDEQLGEHAMHH